MIGPHPLPPQPPPSAARRAAAGVGLLVALPLAVAAEAWCAHREEVALGVIAPRWAGLTGAFRVAQWITGSEGT